MTLKIKVMLMKNFLFLSKYFFIKLSIKIVIFQLAIRNSIEDQCNISAPIKKSDNLCYLTYCSEEQFNMNVCIIDNSIIKTQWLTNIITIGEKNFKYISLTISSKNDLFLHITSSNNNNDINNYFFGLKSNGRPYFNINGNYSTIINIFSEKPRQNGEIINLKVNNNEEKEFLMSIGKDNYNAEIFDFETYNATTFSTSKDLTEYGIISKEFAILKFIENNNYYYILSFSMKNNSINNDGYFNVFQKYNFIYNSNNNKIEYNISNNILKATSKKIFISSCYITNDKLIVCFYFHINNNYTATIFDTNLKEKNTFDFGQPSYKDDIFFKCIHLKDEIGIFYYFLMDGYKPIIDIVEFKKESNGNYIKDYKFKSLTTKKYNISSEMYFNSILKLNENKFGVIQINNNKEIIYVIIYTIFNNFKKINARYYSIDIFSLYNMKVIVDVKSILYNSFFVSTFGFTNGTQYDIFSSVIIFSYPDSKDFGINLINHFKNYSYFFPLNRIINDKIKINNNLFGLVKKGIQIQSFPKNNNDEIILSLFSNLKNSLIVENEIIDKNDKIEFTFTKSEINPAI